MNPVDETNPDQPRPDAAWLQPSGAWSPPTNAWTPPASSVPALPQAATPVWDDPTTVSASAPFAPWATGAPAGVPVVPLQPKPNRSRRAGAVVLVAALCLVSALGGGLAALGTNALTGTNPGAQATSPGGRTVASVPTATPSTANPGATAAPGASPATNPNTTSDENAVIDVAKVVGPSVVTIQSTTTATNQFGQSGQVTGTGSGVIVRADGLILTNHHVVGDAKTVKVLLDDGRILDGTVKGVDTLTDLALVKVDASGLPTATLGDSSTIQVGQRAIAIGSPLGEYPGSVTSGIVSGLDRTIDVANPETGQTEHLQHMIQTDAAINPGNSGGPLLDSAGNVIGIDTAAAGNSQGIGMAIPIDLAKPIIDQVAAGKDISRPWIGIYYLPLTPAIAKDQKLASDYGAWIHIDPSSGSTVTDPVTAGSPAEDAGLKDGDIITQINGQSIDTDHPLDMYLLSHGPGDTITFTVMRGGNTITVDLTLGTRPAALN